MPFLLNLKNIAIISFFISSLATAKSLSNTQPVILMPASQAVIEFGAVCKKYAPANDACVIGFFDKNDLSTSENELSSYRVLLGKISNEYYLIQDFYRNGKKRRNQFQVKATPLLTLFGGTNNLNIHGTVIEWYQNGNKREINRYNKGEKIGVLTEWHENGQKALKERYDKNQQQGVSTAWHPNGKKSSQSMYKDDKLNGLSLDWYSNGQKKRICNYLDNKATGTCINWYKNGLKESEYNYIDGKQEGPSFYWHDNGKLYSRGLYQNNQLNGLEEQWYENGQKKSEVNYVNGKKHGLAIKWDRKGIKVDVADYKNDAIETSSNHVESENTLNTLTTDAMPTAVLPADQAMQELEMRCQQHPKLSNDTCIIDFAKFADYGGWEAGSTKQHDIYRVLKGKTAQNYYIIQNFYASGAKQSNAIQAIDIPEFADLRQGANYAAEGWVRFFYENGQIKSEAYYHNGKKEGTVTNWSKKGIKEFEGNYKAGQIEGTYTYWLSKDRKLIEGEIRDGEQKWVVNNWFPNGQKTSERHFKKDSLESTVFFWHSNGQKRSEATYDDGVLIGEPQYWNAQGERVLSLEEAQ